MNYTFFDFLQLIGSLGIFIFGMKVFSDGLQKVVGGKLRAILKGMTTTRFRGIITGFGFLSILLFVVAGTVLTLLTQSSSAATSITLVMLFQGWIDFPIAAAMVLGENIGTTVTANIAAIIGNVHAKRAARFHFVFNVVGVIWMLILMQPFLIGIDTVMSYFSPDAGSAASVYTAGSYKPG